MKGNGKMEKLMDLEYYMVGMEKRYVRDCIVKMSGVLD